MHQDLANATFRIECSNSSGSGFSFRDKSTIITNHHVIEPHLLTGTDIFAVTANGEKLPVSLVAHSDKSQFDFAVLNLETELPEGRAILQPAADKSIYRGRQILFSGFPHGIHDLLVHEAIISGLVKDHAFYIDGSVNGGNSGGPIIDAETGEVVGIITQRRFLGAESLQTLGQQVSQLAGHCAAIAGQGKVVLMGIDFGQFAGMIAEGFSALAQVIQANANSGIGIGFKIEYVEYETDKLAQ